jgi:hypothetical protein
MSSFATKTHRKDNREIFANLLAISAFFQKLQACSNQAKKQPSAPEIYKLEAK